LNLLQDKSYSKNFQEARVLDFYIPQEKTKKDILVFISSSNWQNGDKSDWQQTAEYFCQKGYLVACVNFRLTPDWSFPAQIEDLRLAISYIKKQASLLGFASYRLTIAGVAAGAYLALLLAVITPNEYLGRSDELIDTHTQPKAVIAISPIISLLKETQSSKIDEKIKELLSFDPSKELVSFLKDGSPHKRANDFKCPVLFIHHDTNKDIPMPSLLSFQQDLLHYGVPVKFISGNQSYMKLDSEKYGELHLETLKSIEIFLHEFLV
jgi:acetyl esterase/lipase